MFCKTRQIPAFLAAVAAAAAVGVTSPGDAQEIQEWGQNDGADVLARGPLHEAFAEVVPYDPQPGMIVSEAPPKPIEELVPEQKPEGEGYEWIGGYWAWDDDRNDFLWISGVWRIPPPETQWVPGYWIEAQGGWQWVSGYWAPLGNEQAYSVEYLPAPPATLEVGPSSPAPSDDYFWTSGYWVRYQGHYVWRAGHWSQARTSWIWIPARYVWTPRGCVYVPGHWDYTLQRRGLCFSPVYFHRPIYLHVGFRFRPRVVIYGNLLHQHLFCRPRYGHYYFGDYYASRYEGIGIYPWFSFSLGQRACQPIYSYHRWYFHDRDPDWADRVHRWHRYHRDHERARPPHTLAELHRVARHSADGDRGGRHPLVGSLSDQRHKDRLPVRLEPVSRERLKDLAERNHRLRELTDRRADVERIIREKTGHGSEQRPGRVVLPESSVRRGGDRLAGDRSSPPPRLDGHRLPDRSAVIDRLRQQDTRRTAPAFERPKRTEGPAATHRVEPNRPSARPSLPSFHERSSSRGPSSSKSLSELRERLRSRPDSPGPSVDRTRPTPSIRLDRNRPSSSSASDASRIHRRPSPPSSASSLRFRGRSDDAKPSVSSNRSGGGSLRFGGDSNRSSGSSHRGGNDRSHGSRDRGGNHGGDRGGRR